MNHDPLFKGQSYKEFIQTRLNSDKQINSTVHFISSNFRKNWKRFDDSLRKVKPSINNEESLLIFSNLINSLAIKSYEEENPICCFEEFLSIYFLKSKGSMNNILIPEKSILWTRDKTKFLNFLFNTNMRIKKIVEEFEKTQTLDGKDISFYLNRQLKDKLSFKLVESIHEYRFGKPEISEEYREKQIHENKLFEILRVFSEIIKLDIANNSNFCNSYTVFNAKFSEEKPFLKEIDFNLILENLRSNRGIIYHNNSILFHNDASLNYLDYVISNLSDIFSKFKKEIELNEISLILGDDELYCFGDPNNIKKVKVSEEPVIKLEKTQKNRVIEFINIFREIRTFLNFKQWGKKTKKEKHMFLEIVNRGANYANENDLDLIVFIPDHILHILEEQPEDVLQKRLYGYRQSITNEKFPEFCVFNIINLTELIPKLEDLKNRIKTPEKLQSNKIF